AALGTGFILGPAIGGVLGDVNPRLPFWTAAALCGLNALYGLFVLPESLALQHRRAFSWRTANPFASTFLLGGKRANSPLVRYFIMLLFGYLAQQSLSIFVIYADVRYHWLLRSVGFYLAAAGFVNGIYSVALLKRVVAAVGERNAILIGLTG